MSWHPWRAIRHLDVTVRWERRDGLLGSWDAATRTMTFHPDQSQRQRRCTAAHELVHAERGHQGECNRRLERKVDEEAARRLITLPKLADALVWCVDEWELAEDLWVDQATVRVRLDTLTSLEQQYIDARMASRDGAA
jgi:hypothetical protein